jgi:predicted lipoprotein with Yx(FWY)xxD motif
MSAPVDGRNHRFGGWFLAGSVAAISAIGLAACGDNSSKSGSSSPAAATSASAAPGTSFSVADAPGLGKVVVDGRGHTVYVLTSGTQKNVPCDDASGCTKAWPDLALPSGTANASAGSGLDGSLLGTMKLASGETYPTYGGWLMYEFAGDKNNAEAHGQGISSFGGTWYALSASGTPITTAATTPTTAKKSGGGYGY